MNARRRSPSRVEDGTEICDLTLFSPLGHKREKEDKAVIGGARGSQKCF